MAEPSAVPNEIAEADGRYLDELSAKLKRTDLMPEDRTDLVEEVHRVAEGYIFE